MCVFLKTAPLVNEWFYLINSVRFLIVLTGKATRPTTRDMMVFTRK